MNEVERMVAEIEFQNKINNEKKELEKSFNKNFQTQEGTLNLVIKSVEYSISNDFNESKYIWNMAGYINLTSCDLKIIVRDMTFSDNDWQRKLYARHGYLLIYGSLENILNLCGKGLIDTLKDFENKDTLLANIRNATKLLSNFKNQHIEHIKDVRNKVVGHRDQNVLLQLKAVKSITWIDSFNLFKTYDEILNKLGKATQKLMDESNRELAMKRQ